MILLRKNVILSGLFIASIAPFAYGDTYGKARVQNFFAGNKTTLLNVEDALKAVSQTKIDIKNALADKNTPLSKLKKLTDDVIRDLKNANTYLEALILSMPDVQTRKKIDPYDRTTIAQIASHSVQNDQFNEVVKIIDKIFKDLDYPNDVVTKGNKKYFNPFNQPEWAKTFRNLGLPDF